MKHIGTSGGTDRASGRRFGGVAVVADCALLDASVARPTQNWFFRLTACSPPPRFHPLSSFAHENTINVTQVTHMYSHGNARNDHTVLHYGFLDRSRWEQPRVCCSDLEGGNLWNCNAVDRDFGDLGAGKDGKRVAAMRRSKTKRERHAPNYK